MTASIKETISLDILDKIDIRVGTIQSVEDVVKSDKLVKLTVDFGEFVRTILVGMKGERENPKEIEGMLFDIGYADGIIPVLAQPEKPVPDGTRAG